MTTLDFSNFHPETLRISFLKPKQLEVLKDSEAVKADLVREIEGSTIEEAIDAERDENLDEGLNRMRVRESRWLWWRGSACIN